MRTRGSTPAGRQQLIAEHVVQKRSASIADLAGLCQVSEMTIYRDVEELERQGVVRKVRGAVTAQPSGVFESNVAYRLASMRAEKDAVARRARVFVEPGMSVLLDDATSTLALARLLEDVEPLTVATNYLETMKLVSGFRGTHLIALGGDYDPTHDSFLGVPCVDAIEALRVDAVFVSVSSVSGGHAYHQQQHVVAVKRAMLRSARRRFLLVDHSKIGRDALYQLAPLTTFERVIVDDGAPAGSLAELGKHGVAYEVAPLPG
ncbi:MAG: DeoR/GlpR family DNA-binding transcription regulator [Streptosporangiales bacterium]